jgi:hypothetical protein
MLRMPSLLVIASYVPLSSTLDERVEISFDRRMDGLQTCKTLSNFASLFQAMIYASYMVEYVRGTSPRMRPTMTARMARKFFFGLQLAPWGEYFPTHETVNLLGPNGERGACTERTQVFGVETSTAKLRTTGLNRALQVNSSRP